MTISQSEMVRMIEHTLLAAETTTARIDTLSDQAVEYGFRAVCVNPVYVRRAVERLNTSRELFVGQAFQPVSRPTRKSVPQAEACAPAPVVVAAVGFPLGASRTATKVDEARRALDDGAAEIDMVAPLGALIAGDRIAVRRDIEAVAKVVHKIVKGGILKVILETAAITTEQIVLGCRCCAEGEADFVKTSTGFHPAGGATVEHVRLLHRCASPLRVKASGGIRTAATACAMLEAGATRLGTSSGVAIVEDLRRAAP